MQRVHRIFVEKKKGFDNDARRLFYDLKHNLGITALEGVRLYARYDVSGISPVTLQAALNTVFSEPPADSLYIDELPDNGGSCFAVEYLPGQYDQRADSAVQALQLLHAKDSPMVRTARVYRLLGNLSDADLKAVKEYIINPVDSREASMDKPDSLELLLSEPGPVAAVQGFRDMQTEELEELRRGMGLAMSLNDLKFTQDYFKKLKRNPTVTEIRVLDTYWSDHCRHTTFLTELYDIQIEDSRYTGRFSNALRSYYDIKTGIGRRKKPVSLMDIALSGMRHLIKQGLLPDLDESDEINACSIKINVEVDGRTEPWLLMFKNETHNHPTEIEPFGGAATCLGGAIRDPLSGRSYVYQAMRVTGSADPRKGIEETIGGKLPQRKLTTEAAAGYSSYGNQIGLATGQVAEIYDEGFMAKRMEIGAVIGAAPAGNVVRMKPEPGDKVVLLGGRTGRDGCGGATGSSKAHDQSSIETCGAEVQKGNAPTERKLQRLFRNPEASRLIKKCNDFGAGGVCVAIGELAGGLFIDLDNVPKKYDGLDGTELAISESQERMAVVLSPGHVEKFIALADAENLEATVVAEVTNNDRMVMTWRGQKILELDRSFIDSNGAPQYARAVIGAPDENRSPFAEKAPEDAGKAWRDMLADLNICSQRGLAERFDASIGAGTVLMPFAGKYQQTPVETMAARIPVSGRHTDTSSVMAFGFIPEIAKYSPFHGAVYAVLQSVLKVACAGADPSGCRLTFQEYFESLRDHPARWGKPLAALLGALEAQTALGCAAIGGKDSMSGSFEDMDVPPTLVSFAVAVENANNIISAELKKTDSRLVLVAMRCDGDNLPDYGYFQNMCARIYAAIGKGTVLAAHTVSKGGTAAALTKMAVGNRIGARLCRNAAGLLSTPYLSVVLEVASGADLDCELEGCDFEIIGSTNGSGRITAVDFDISLDKAVSLLESPLEGVFPVRDEEPADTIQSCLFQGGAKIKRKAVIARPRVLIPVFPGTNCEYDSEYAFTRAGAEVKTLVIRNIRPGHIEESIQAVLKAMDQSQIIMFPGGFSLGDEPDGSGKFIAAFFREARLAEAIERHLYQNDGLILGICNGFQALIKLGLVPNGHIIDMKSDSPTLTYNKIGRHQSRIVGTKIVSNLSPWLAGLKPGDVIHVPVSHGEGRFVCAPAEFDRLLAAGQIATQYCDMAGNPTYDIRFNPNGSFNAVEGISSPDGRVLGKMGHNERYAENTFRNVPGNYESRIFESGVGYFL